MKWMPNKLAGHGLVVHPLMFEHDPKKKNLQSITHQFTISQPNKHRCLKKDTPTPLTLYKCDENCLATMLGHQGSLKVLKIEFS